MSEILLNDHAAVALERWRHLVEPVTSSGVTAIPWDGVVSSNPMVLEGERSVLVVRPSSFSNAWTIWVAAGELGEVLELAEHLYDYARQNGVSRIIYMGRRGWIQAAGYVEDSVIGVKEL